MKKILGVIVVVACGVLFAEKAFAPPLSFGRCGDRVLQKGEQCDDGNRRSGDSCSSECKREGAPTASCPTCPVCRECPACPAQESCPSGGRTTPVYLGAELFVDQICFTMARDPGGRIPVIAVEYIIRNTDVFGRSVGSPIPGGLEICSRLEKGSSRYRECQTTPPYFMGQDVRIGVSPGLERLTITLDSENVFGEINEVNNVIRCTSFDIVETTSEAGSGPGCLHLGNPSLDYITGPGYEGPCPLMRAPDR